MIELLENGLSGWIISLITLLIGGGIVVRHVYRRKTRQSNISAGGDVAGGDIIKGTRKVHNRYVSSMEVSKSVQTNIVAEGDVAGGNIVKGDE